MTSSRRVRDDRGVSAVEMAFIAPSLIFLIFFTIQGALFFYGRNVAIQSAREGVSQLRLASDRATYDAIRGGAEKNTAIFAGEIGRESLIDPQVTSHYDNDHERVRVDVSGRVISLVPFLDLKVSTHAYGPVERFGVDPGGTSVTGP